MDHADGSKAVKVRGRSRLRLRIALCHQRQETVATHDVVDEPHGARLAHGERDRRQREHDRVPKRQDRQRVGNDEVAGAGLNGVAGGLVRHHRFSPRFGSVMRSRPRS